MTKNKSHYNKMFKEAILIAIGCAIIIGAMFYGIIYLIP